MIGKTWWKRFGVVGLAVGLVAGGASVSGAVPPPLPPGTVVTCSQISGAVTLNPGIGLAGTSTGVKWSLKAVVNNCTTTNSAGTTSSWVMGGIVRGSGYFVGGNTCSAAAVAANYGAGPMKVQWIATPNVASTVYSPVASGAFLPGTGMDAIGLSMNRLHVGTTPVSLQLGGDWTVASAAQLATDCSGPAPASRTLTFQTPATGSPHLPAFIASI